MENVNSKIICSNKYEFLDFGCSGGDSLNRYGELFNIKGKGLGLDINPTKVQATIDKGFDAQVVDITNLKLDNKVKFIVMHHFLEHIPSLFDVNKIIRVAVSAVDEFVIIRQPYFDADPYLFSLGLKLYWSDWSGHPNNMTMLELHNVLKPMAAQGLIKSFAIYGIWPIETSLDPSIHNIDSPVDQHQWDKFKHSKKNPVQFDFPIYKETMAILDIDGNSIEKVESILSRDKTCKPCNKMFDSKVS